MKLDPNKTLEGNYRIWVAQQKDAMQEHYIKKIFIALANHDDRALWSAVHELADLREERPDAILFKLYEGLKQDNRKLIEAQNEWTK